MIRWLPSASSSLRLPPPTAIVSNSNGEPESVVTRRAFSLLSTATASATVFSFPLLFCGSLARCSAAAAVSQFTQVPDSGGVKVLDIRIGYGDSPVNGDKVAIHYYGRLAAKQGWRFDSSYDHKDKTGDPIPFVFTFGSGKGLKQQLDQ